MAVVVVGVVVVALPADAGVVVVPAVVFVSDVAGDELGTGGSLTTAPSPWT